MATYFFGFITLVGLLLVIYSLIHMIAPANKFERELDDKDQMEYLKKMTKKD